MINKIGKRAKQTTKDERFWKLVNIGIDYPNYEFQCVLLLPWSNFDAGLIYCLVNWQEQQIQTSIQIRLLYVNT